MPGVVRTYLLPVLVDPAQLVGGTVVVIDQLRASTTICAALAAGATGVHPFLTPEQALEHKERRRTTPSLFSEILLGGERESVRIKGFDLGNSPAEYTPARVGGKTIFFTTTNGTKAVELAHQSSGIVMGCLANLSALVDQIGGTEGNSNDHTIHIICAGTRDRVTQEDILAAGAIAERLIARGHTANLADPRPDDDSTLLALYTWRAAQAEKGGVLNALLNSRGGRNLIRVGLRDDVIFCSQIDNLPIVPWLAPTGVFVNAATWA